MAMDRARSALRTYFGYDSFRQGQEELIGAILSHRDALGIMPTGAGKSICYQIPAVLMPGLTIVVSPLISLMKDQVDALNESGISAALLNSTLTVAEMNRRYREIEAGRYRVVYIAPERLESDRFTGWLDRVPVSLVAVDEAHCISQWGHDFRPSYLSIARLTERLDPRPVVAAFTATATPEVREDIVNRLRLHAPVRVTTGYARPNLSFRVARGGDKRQELLRCLREHDGEAGIVYASTRREVEECHAFLAGQGFRAGKYHAGLDERARAEAQDAFLRDDLQVMVATNAFGMGIDKSNVRYVVHYNLPKNLEAYYQEAGRAGRDGAPGECILFYFPQDTATQKYLIEQGEGDEERKKTAYRQLNDMVQYAFHQECLQQAIVSYFGDVCEPCGKCGNCLDTAERIDVTEAAKVVFACVAGMRQRFGVSLTAKVLRGSGEAKIREFGFDRLPVYGRMSKRTEKEIVGLIQSLAAQGYLRVTDSAYPVVTLTPRVRSVMDGEERVYRRVEQVRAADVPGAAGTSGPGRRGPRGGGDDLGAEGEALFAKLRTLRKSLADRENVPPFVIFNDATLREICRIRPTTERDMRSVKGIGEAKLAKYGRVFLEVIREH
ncbi:DNA helicase RecQ [Cohnella sp. CFH 77786]|uniref:DNA helicase RecQ n=1 Tax=Cohnella sp. CFH 77786 TaxID=2662265 RepID=UPI001C6094E5|nr:DNA helicase RecQ [Cohnella sp. CFH 77786]MBW5446875.1 DNA helicase RecQ [Cohnella sp. CFH 77786]